MVIMFIFPPRVQDGIELNNILFTVESVLKKIKNLRSGAYNIFHLAGIGWRGYVRSAAAAASTGPRCPAGRSTVRQSRRHPLASDGTSHGPAQPPPAPQGPAGRRTVLRSRHWSDGVRRVAARSVEAAAKPSGCGGPPHGPLQPPPLHRLPAGRHTVSALPPSSPKSPAGRRTVRRTGHRPLGRSNAAGTGLFGSGGLPHGPPEPQQPHRPLQLPPALRCPAGSEWSAVVDTGPLRSSRPLYGLAQLPKSRRN